MKSIIKRIRGGKIIGLPEHLQITQSTYEQTLTEEQWFAETKASSKYQRDSTLECEIKIKVIQTAQRYNKMNQIFQPIFR